MAALTPWQRTLLYLTERADDPSKSPYIRTPIPVLGVPLTDQLQDALARLITASKNNPAWLPIALPDRPLSVKREGIATASDYERIIHDLLLWALRVVIEPSYRGWLRNMMRGNTRRPRKKAAGPNPETGDPGGARIKP